MLYDVICTRRGKEEIVFTGELAKANREKRRRTDSQRGGIRGDRVTYTIRPSVETAKYKKPPHYKNGREH